MDKNNGQIGKLVNLPNKTKEHTVQDRGKIKQVFAKEIVKSFFFLWCVNFAAYACTFIIWLRVNKYLAYQHRKCLNRNQYSFFSLFINFINNNIILANNATQNIMLQEQTKVYYVDAKKSFEVAG